MTGRVVVVALVVLAAAACTGGEARVAPAPSTTDPATSSTTIPTSTVSASTVPASTVPLTTAPATSVPAGPPELLIEGSPMIRFSVAVGDGIDDLTRDDLARFVVDTLADERSWIGRGAGFELLDEGGLFTFIVALPDDVDEMCAVSYTHLRAIQFPGSFGPFPRRPRWSPPTVRAPGPTGASAQYEESP